MFNVLTKAALKLYSLKLLSQRRLGVCNIHFPLFVVFDVTRKKQMCLFAVSI